MITRIYVDGYSLIERLQHGCIRGLSAICRSHASKAIRLGVACNLEHAHELIRDCCPLVGTHLIINVRWVAVSKLIGANHVFSPGCSSFRRVASRSCWPTIALPMHQHTPPILHKQPRKWYAEAANGYLVATQRAEKPPAMPGKYGPRHAGLPWILSTSYRANVRVEGASGMRLVYATVLSYR